MTYSARAADELDPVWLVARKLQQRVPAVTCWVYFLEYDRAPDEPPRDEFELIKVGATDDPMRRLRALERAEGHRLAFLVLVPGDERLESALHDLAWPTWERGDWFRRSRELRVLRQGLARHALSTYRQFRRGALNAHAPGKQWTMTVSDLRG